MNNFSGFSEWIHQDESVVDAVFGVFDKLHKAINTSTWAVQHPAQVPSEVANAITNEWHSLVEKYGYTEAVLILASLVVAIGPGLLIPGSIVLFWVTLGACKLFNTVVGKGKTNESEVRLNDDERKVEADAIRERLINIAKKVEIDAR